MNVRAAVLAYLVLACGCDRLLGLTPVAAVPDGVTPDAPQANSWTAVSGGRQHACAIKGTNQLYCFGDNMLGQSALGATVLDVPSPTQVQGGWISVATQTYHTCAIADDRALWCWGREIAGELGNGIVIGAFYMPVPVIAPAGTQWTEVATSTSHTCAIRADQTLWCWGSNASGESAFGVGDPVLTPTQVTNPTTTWAHVALGDQHTCAIDAGGMLYCWGANVAGQLGTMGGGASATPILVSTATDWTAIAAAAAHTCGIHGGELDCWGENYGGQLGDGTPTARQMPTRVAANGTWQAVATAAMHTCALQTDNSWWCWGTNDYDQLATTTATSYVPEQIPGAWTAVTVGGRSSCAIDTIGGLWCVGRNGYGELGNGRGGPVLVPALVGSGAWNALAAGANTSCAVQNQALYCWGDNGTGQLGDSTAYPREQPNMVDVTPVMAAATRQTHTCELATNGHMLCAGDNRHGNFGVPSTTIPSSTSMVPVVGTLTWSRLAIGEWFTCAMSTETTPTLYCWGMNDQGQVGAASGGADVSSPAPVPAPATFAGIGAGGAFACGLAGGSVYCWGRSSHGETGAAAGTSSPVLTKLAGGHVFTKLAVGLLHACAIEVGAIYCWGFNGSGELGDGTQNDSATPVQAGITAAWLAVSAGGYHTCAIDSDQALWCWGRNNYGQLGDGTRQDRHLPKLISSTELWTEVVAGDSHTCARTATGDLRCWGAQQYGQVGNGAAWSATPTFVP